MPDLQINYDRLHELAGQARLLKEHLDDKVPGLSTGVINANGSRGEGVGDPKVASALSHFYHAWDKPFRDSMKRLDEMGELLDSVATQFFTMDAKFAAKAQSSLSAMMYAQWQSERDEYQSTRRRRTRSSSPHRCGVRTGASTTRRPCRCCRGRTRRRTRERLPPS